MSTLEDMGDMSNLCQFVLYKWTYFRQQTAVFHTRRNSLVDALARPRMMGMKGASGFSSRMAKLSPAELLEDCCQKNLARYGISASALTLLIVVAEVKLPRKNRVRAINIGKHKNRYTVNRCTISNMVLSVEDSMNVHRPIIYY